MFVESTHVGCEFGYRHIPGHMGSFYSKGTGAFRVPVFDIHECAREACFLGEAHFAVAYGGGTAEWVSERPDRLSEHSFYVAFAVLNFAAGFFITAQ